MSTLQLLWQDFGQAVWLDNIERALVSGNGLSSLVAEDGVRGELVAADKRGLCEACVANSVLCEACVANNVCCVRRV